MYSISKIDGEYFLDPQPPEAFTDKVFTQKVDGEDMAYIEPSGATPDGYFFPVMYVGMLLDEDIITPYYYERAPEDMPDDLAFAIVGDEDSPEGKRRLARIVRLTARRA